MSERERFLLWLGAELLERAAKDIDAMFPNDEHPEMQADLRQVAETYRNLGSERDAELERLRARVAALSEALVMWQKYDIVMAVGFTERSDELYDAAVQATDKLLCQWGEATIPREAECECETRQEYAWYSCTAKEVGDGASEEGENNAKR